MSDTTITAEEMAEIRRRFEILRRGHPITGSFSLGVHMDGYLRNYAHGFEVNFIGLLDALEQSEARVKSRNNHIHRLLGEALENERNLDGMKSRWQTAEAENARLTKERDWLAKALAEDGCPYLALWSDFGSEMRPDWCICIDTADDGFDCNGNPKECWKKEAARRAVAAGEETCQK